ncbi:hypothetical protein [Pseudomonas sp. NBRC 111127]|uniref:hypothetical protein n=1 Tax=Pseudomonas sp. NBRC 111127 TaxID=1661042 RepID=UPI000AB279B3
MNGSLSLLKAIPIWVWISLAAAGVIWWQHAQIKDARVELAALNQQAGQCKEARDNLVALAGEQGKALGDLTLAASERQARVAQAVAEAGAGAKVDYAAANRLQQERTGGDQCAAATSIIDLELGL